MFAKYMILDRAKDGDDIPIEENYAKFGFY